MVPALGSRFPARVGVGGAPEAQSQTSEPQGAWGQREGGGFWGWTATIHGGQGHAAVLIQDGAKAGKDLF